MAQTTKKIYVDSQAGSTYEQYDVDEVIALTTTYVVVLKIDARKFRESVFAFRNLDTVDAVTYKIFGSAKELVDLDTADPEADDEWVNLLSAGVYSHTAEKTVAIDSREFDALSNPWRYVIVMAKIAAGTGTLKLWHRGEN